MRATDIWKVAKQLGGGWVTAGACGAASRSNALSPSFGADLYPWMKAMAPSSSNADESGSCAEQGSTLKWSSWAWTHAFLKKPSSSCTSTGSAFSTSPKRHSTAKCSIRLRVLRPTYFTGGRKSEEMLWP